MAKSDFKSVDEYLASQPEAVRDILERVRGAIRKAVPGAEEGISYQIPAYKLHGGVVLHFAGWRQHYSLYPATSRVVPVKLIERIAKFRAKEEAEREKAKIAAVKKR